jgi:hypothetical protein
MFKLFVVVLVFGKIVGVVGFDGDKAACDQKATEIYGQIVAKGKAQGVSSVMVDGKAATEKDLSVVCKRYIKTPTVQAEVKF